MYLTAKGLVLREARYKDAHKMLTILTEKDGKLSVSARNALKKNSQIAAISQALCFGEFTLFGKDNQMTVNEGEPIEQFLGLRNDIEKLSLGMYFTELLEVVADADAPSSQILSLGLNSLFALSRGLYENSHIKAVFELRLMCLSGYTPFLEHCSECENFGENEMMMFSLNGGNLHCTSCASGSYGVSLPVCPPTLEAMRFIVSAPSKKVFSFLTEGEATDRLSKICEGYVAGQLDRKFKTLDYYKKIRII